MYILHVHFEATNATIPHFSKKTNKLKYQLSHICIDDIVSKLITEVFYIYISVVQIINKFGTLLYQTIKRKCLYNVIKLTCELIVICSVNIFN